MVDYFQGATFEENGQVRRSAYRGVGDVVKTNVTMRHHIPLSELIEYIRENARDVPFDSVMVNWGTVHWEDAATLEEITAWREREARKQQATEEWERKTLARLAEKYGAPVQQNGSL